MTLIKVDGDSMSPRMINGDFVVVNHLVFRYKIDDIIVVNHPIYERLIKRIKAISTDGRLWLQGENDSSIKSETMGLINRDWIIGKVIYTVSR